MIAPQDVGGAQLHPVDAPPPSNRGRAPNKVRPELIAGYLMGFPGQWFHVDTDHRQPSVVANRIAKHDVEAITSNNEVYARFSPGGAA